MKNLVKNIIIKILEFQARVVLKRFKPKIVAVTGSVGKTSAKDAIFTVLNDSFYSQTSKKSYNSEFGVPLTILGKESGWTNPFRWLKIIFQSFSLIFLPHHYPKVLVLEVGADRPGDIKKIAGWLKPDIAVVTAIGQTPVHVEFFSSPEEVAKEKSFLPASLSESGIAILNADDEKVSAMKEKTKGHVITYGFNDEADLNASAESILYDKNGDPEGVIFRVDFGGKSVPIKILGSLGKSQVYATLSALAVAICQEINLVKAAESLNAHKPPPGRLRIIKGIKETIIIDDTYNSSPIAVKNALETLGKLEVKGRRIAVLGDMMELGVYTKDEHEKIGKIVPGMADELFVVGPRAEFIADSAKELGMPEGHISKFSDSRECGKYLQNFIKKGDVILVKGSQSIRTERVVEEIMAEPERKGELLVRQEREWRGR